ncbi:MAG: DUF1997 domain-containing protein [Cyanobacteria bacterium J06633_2]
MLSRFKAYQTVDITVSEEIVPIQHYLRQPQRIINALADPKRIEFLGDNVFRLKMRPLGFMMLKIQPTVDMKLWAEQDGSIALESVKCDIKGVDFINQRFDLVLKGILSPITVQGKTHLVGRADLQVTVDVPLPLALTPRPIVESTGDKVLLGVLATVKQRLMHQLLADYRFWAIAHRDDLKAAPDRTLLPHQGSTI